MIEVLSAGRRGRTELGWLDSRHSFSFGDFHEPSQMGFGALRVVNDDRVKGGMGFGTHPHRDMEIVSYVLEGALEHKDSLGNGSIIRPGDVQRMSAGTGVLHSEFNPSKSEPVRFLQLWILPEAQGLSPSYEQQRFEPDTLRGRLRLVASRDGREGSVVIHQDVSVHAGKLSPGEEATLSLAPGRRAWVQVAVGAVTVNGRRLSEGDGAGVRDEPTLSLAGEEAAEVLVFDLA